MKLNNKSKIIITMSIVLFVFTILTIISAMQKSQQPTIETTPTHTNIATVEPIAPTCSPTVRVSTSTATLTPTPSTSPTQTVLEPSVGDSTAIGEITIYTDRKTRTYDIMPDVDEATLKRNIGQLPGSAFPGQSGICVLMGHRDTDFSILKYSKAGDSIFMKYKDKDTVYSYTVKYIEIVDNNDELKFEALDGDYLVLVTCYPFNFLGNAPMKCLVVCEIISS